MNTVPAAAGRSATAVQTIERGMQVLRAFRADRAPLTNAELVRRTGLSKATVSRLTSTLLQLGYLRHVAGERSFELAAGSFAMGHAFLHGSDLVRRAQPLLQALAERLGGSAALAVADDLDMIYIAYGASHRVATLRLGVGSVLPMGMTAIGRAYVWALPPAERARRLAQLRAHAGPQLAALDRGLAESFAELASTGLCSVSDGALRDTYGLALPVHVGRQRLLMGLSCGRAVMAPDLAAERQRVAPLLLQGAAELESLLADADGQP